MTTEFTLSIKAKQVAGVTTLVVVVVLAMSAWQMSTLLRLRLEQTQSSAHQLADAIFQRAYAVVSAAPADAYVALREDSGLRSILLASIAPAHPEGQNILYAAIVGPEGEAIVHSSPEFIGEPMPEQAPFGPLVDGGSPWKQARAVYDERRFEVHRPILAGEQAFGEIRIGVSTLLVRDEIEEALWRAGQTAIAALAISTIVAMLLAQWMLRPIHIIQSGLSRLGRGELDVRLDLPEQEFRDLGSSFDAVSAQLAAIRSKALPSASTDFESVMENLEDAVALFSPAGELVFGNAAMRALLPALASRAGESAPAVELLPPDHPVRQLVERSLAARKSQGPVSQSLGAPADPDAGTQERLLLCHAIEDATGRFLGVMLVARNLGFLSHVHTTLNYSRKLAALGRLMAGVAHEVKNPLNAMTIHLELLKQKLGALHEPIVVPAGPRAGRPLDLEKHVRIIADEIRRLDQVVVGFLKFARPDELKLQPVRLCALLNEVTSITAPEAESRRVVIRTDCPANLPDINADPGMLQQALLNLTINACQAMPDGGTLRVACRAAAGRRVEIDIEDTGVGIPPEDLGRIFDLYFTTKEKGSGIGLSMVFRIVQLHDGEVEVQSTPGRGTTFKLIFPQA